MCKYSKISKSGNEYRAIFVSSTDIGDLYAIIRNQNHCPDDWFLIGFYPYDEAVKKIDFFCR